MVFSGLQIFFGPYLIDIVHFLTQSAKGDNLYDQGSGCTVPREQLVALVRLAQGFNVQAIDYIPTPKDPFLCPKCGGKLIAKCIPELTFERK